MKQFVSFIVLALFTVIMVSPTLADGHADGDNQKQELLVESQLDTLDLDEIEQFWERVKSEYNGFLPENQPLRLKDFFLMEESFFTKDLLTGFIKYIFQEIWLNGKLLGSIIILTVFSMLLEHIQSAFEKNNVSKVGYAITYLVIFILAIHSFSSAMTYAQDAISTMVHFMMALMPMILALLASMGNFTSVALFHPLIIFLIHISGVVIYSVVFPLLFFSAILSIISTFSEQYKVTQLANLLRNITIGILGGLLTIFLTVVSVQGASSAVVDGVTIKAAKFITGNFVPVVGKMFTDATDTVISASLLVKNTIGLAGLFILLIICTFPAMKILVLAFIFHLSAALLQPLGNSNIIPCLQTISRNLIFVFAALASVSLMFFLGLTMIIAAGNLSLMVR